MRSLRRFAHDQSAPPDSFPQKAATTLQGSLQGSRAPSEGKVANRQASDPQRLQSNEIETLE